MNRIENFDDIALHTPSMSYTELQGFSQIAIRGVGTDLTNLANETAVAMYEDGVYRGATFAQTVPQFDMERIEVLRGPQGTLYGRNATGGAVNIITRDPTFEPEFNASMTGGNYDHIRGEVGVSGALVDDVVAGRASFVYDTHSGYNDNKTL
ncbi:MAG TPA: TonB-dependent receptor plug domain-containing protein, partial [Pseudomonadales bacterium]|nr:TonB-dependent receptor plug domain-containing protein [Pseudomonadales bacterium]